MAAAISPALPVRLVEKPWGVEVLPAPFAGDPRGAGRRIGEIWFEPPAAVPELLLKYIFSSDKLSVQVHPSDAQTLAQGLGRQGKEECWLVIDAGPDARLGIGFHEPVEPEAMRAAALDGSIEQMLVWHQVQAGDFFYIPANTVHAIGAGVSVVEVQQNSDITYRLFDYGRPRALHLEESLAVALGTPYDLARHHRRLGPGGDAQLVEGPYFRLDRVEGLPDAGLRAGLAARYGHAPLVVLPLAGALTVMGATVAAGGCAIASTLADIAFAPGGQCLLAQPLGVSA